MNYLIVFAKYPQLGRVKTRLAATLGPQRALTIYQGMLHQLVEQILPQNGEYQTVLCLDPPEQKSAFAKLFPQFSQYWIQGDGDLGQRMERALARACQAGSRKTLIIGSDCLGVDYPLLLNAFHDLEQTDVLLGPAQDGGYYLIGAKQHHPILFQDIPWSTSEVFYQTKQRAQVHGLSLGLLPKLRDIDTAQDYQEEFQT